MGMDNTFFKIKKDELKDKKHIYEKIYETGKYEEYELVYFRKAYRLNEIIEQVLKTDFIEHEIITKEQLKNVIDILNDEYKKLNSIENETDNQIIRRLFLSRTKLLLEIIYKLFDFENYYLIYECIY